MLIVKNSCTHPCVTIYDRPEKLSLEVIFICEYKEKMNIKNGHLPCKDLTLRHLPIQMLTSKADELAQSVALAFR